MKRVLKVAPWLILLGVFFAFLAGKPIRESWLTALSGGLPGGMALVGMRGPAAPPDAGGNAAVDGPPARAGAATRPQLDADHASASAPPADDDAPTGARAQRREGRTSVRLDPEEQALTGIRVLTVSASLRQAESLATGKVVEIQPLADLRALWNSARGDLAAAHAAIGASIQNAERQRMLNRDGGNASTRQLQAAEAQAAADRVRLASATRRLDDVRNQALSQWGATLVNAVLADPSPFFERLVAHEDVLVLVALPPGMEMPAKLDTAFVSPSGDRRHAREAHLISAATQTDGVTQGETWYFRTAGAGLRLGMRIDAWIARSEAPQAGVEVPNGAAIWYANRLWVYVQAGPSHYERRLLGHFEETRDGWFVTDGLAPGTRIVVSGAQMLFSEEFRTGIPSEDEGRD